MLLDKLLQLALRHFVHFLVPPEVLACLVQIGPAVGKSNLQPLHPLLGRRRLGLKRGPQPLGLVLGGVGLLPQTSSLVLEPSDALRLVLDELLQLYQTSSCGALCLCGLLRIAAVVLALVGCTKLNPLACLCTGNTVSQKCQLLFKMRLCRHRLPVEAGLVRLFNLDELFCHLCRDFFANLCLQLAKTHFGFQELLLQFSHALQEAFVGGLEGGHRRRVFVTLSLDTERSKPSIDTGSNWCSGHLLGQCRKLENMHGFIKRAATCVDVDNHPCRSLSVEVVLEEAREFAFTVGYETTRMPVMLVPAKGLQTFAQRHEGRVDVPSFLEPLPCCARVAVTLRPSQVDNGKAADAGVVWLGDVGSSDDFDGENAMAGESVDSCQYMNKRKCTNKDARAQVGFKKRK
eukprot:m.238653 g.238653  ORF g.238653 m.238653 type:complete len:403 (-) comp18969_c0_seq6:1262-2470(-)